VTSKKNIIISKARRYRKDVENFFEMPFEAISSLPHMFPILHAYLVSVVGIPPDDLDPSYNFIWKHLLERIILPVAFKYSENHHNCYHGMDHCHDVALAAGHIALTGNKDPLPAMLAGAIHDICRNGINDHDHGKAAAEKLPLILHDIGKGLFDRIDIGEIAIALREHSQESIPSSHISAYLRDADRLRLAWERGVYPDFFATDEGKNAARLGRYYLLTSIENDFGCGITEVKTEITNQCNLSCPFCHQGFGSNKRHDHLAVDNFRQVLEYSSESNITSIRITGGEPCLHPDIKLFLEMAKDFGMDVILNTNGTAMSIDRYLELAKYIACFKVSLPYAREKDAQHAGLPRSLFQKKIELIATLYAHGHVVEVLTIMAPLNIEYFDDFVDLLDPLARIRWVPLRAEPSETQRRPVNREDIRNVAAKILHLRSAGGERWADLQLHLAVPFCVLEESTVAPVVFSGRQTCGPIQSLTVTPDNHLISCYSERSPLPVSRGGNLQMVAWNAPQRRLNSLPDCCQGCMHGYLCMGGCITEYALEDTPFGKLDYLADPDSLYRNEKHIT
jgi:radical SAM protein with 4Fe4S-binding SPASM domain